MGFPTASRPPPIYPPKMPILEALMALSFVASATSRIGLGTEVLVLPQRQPVLVAKQVATLDTLSGGRVRLGVGVGWQESEYEALEESFRNRGKRMDEAIRVMRAYWRDEQRGHRRRLLHRHRHGHGTQTSTGRRPAHLDRGRLGGRPAPGRRTRATGGWPWPSRIPAVAVKCRNKIAAYAEAAGRDPDSIGYQQMLAPPPRDEAGKKLLLRHGSGRFARAVEALETGFEWGALNATAIFQSGARSVDAMLDILGTLHDAIRRATD